MNISPENYRNFVQAPVAFVESLIFFNDKWTKDLAFGAIIFLATFVPSVGWGYGLLNPNTELLWENIVAMLLSAIIITPIWGGGVLNNMMKAFLLYSSSVAVTTQMLSPFFTNMDLTYYNLRSLNPDPTFNNLATLG